MRGKIETGSYLGAFPCRAPNKNHEAITQNLKKFIPWFENTGARIEYYWLGGSETQELIDSSKECGTESMESLVSTLAIEGDEDIWTELQYFRHHDHC
jgi:hypothetical protein